MTISIFVLIMRYKSVDNPLPLKSILHYCNKIAWLILIASRADVRVVWLWLRLFGFGSGLRPYVNLGWFSIRVCQVFGIAFLWVISAHMPRNTTRINLQPFPFWQIYYHGFMSDGTWSCYKTVINLLFIITLHNLVRLPWYDGKPNAEMTDNAFFTNTISPN